MRTGHCKRRSGTGVPGHRAVSALLAVSSAPRWVRTRGSVGNADPFARGIFRHAHQNEIRVGHFGYAFPPTQTKSARDFPTDAVHGVAQVRQRTCLGAENSGRHFRKQRANATPRRKRRGRGAVQCELALRVNNLLIDRDAEVPKPTGQIECDMLSARVKKKRRARLRCDKLRKGLGGAVCGNRPEARDAGSVRGSPSDAKRGHAGRSPMMREGIHRVFGCEDHAIVTAQIRKRFSVFNPDQRRHDYLGAVAQRRREPAR